MRLFHLPLLLLSLVVTAQTNSHATTTDTNTHRDISSSKESVRNEDSEWTERIAIDYFAAAHKRSPQARQSYYYKTHNTSRRDYNGNLRPQSPRARSRAPEVDHRTLVAIIANFRGYSSVECSAKEVEDTIFGGSGGDEEDSFESVAGFYREQTHGKVHFASSYEPSGVPNVVGPLTITIDSSAGCAPLDWAEKIEAAAYSLGTNLNNYQHKMFIIPKTDVNL